MKDLVLHEALTLLGVCPVPMLLLNDSGHIRACNKAFASLTGSNVETLTEPRQPDDLILPLLGDSTVLHWIMPDGVERWLAVEHHEIDDSPGNSVRFYIDITEQLRLRKERDALASELQGITLHDHEFVSLLSRYGLQTALEPLVARCRRYNSPLSVIALGIRSEPGSARNMVLRRITTLLRDQTRWADLVGCNEARDIILILQETSQDAALLLIDKLATHIERMNAGASCMAQACFGVTQCQKNDDAVSLLERAEDALQEAYRNDTGRSIAVQETAGFGRS
jgi:GGDEF domain-containing protein